jgi:hypothetical protein
MPEDKARYPRLREYLTSMSTPMKAAFTVQDVADMFDVSTRTIQTSISTGKLKQRDVPGKARIFPADLEEMLARHREPPEVEACAEKRVTGPRPMPQRVKVAGLLNRSAADVDRIFEEAKARIRRSHEPSLPVLKKEGVEKAMNATTESAC